MAEMIYGLLLILFIIFLPAGIYGSLRELFHRAAARSREPVAAVPSASR
jgi:hypothetical protein